MNRRALVLLVCTGLLLLVFSLAWFLNDQRRVVAKASSPDGSWAVVVLGQKRLLGLWGIEVYVEVRDGRGRPLPGAYVIGVCDNWAEARRDFGSVSCGNAQAIVNGSTITRRAYLGR